ncbi:mucin-5AC-like [Malaya genurostris]|uniref:mucin-5AC-like n=1 Tax=Malaya genurostris TaxID=325434 RepID=UPI0026F3853D|nr:mucin-5AC-like [Malaya genurostris]
MMLKLLIVACVVTHGLGRPDVSHILKQNRSDQQNKFLHSLDYLAQLKSNPEKHVASEKVASVFDYLTLFNETQVNSLGFGSPISSQKQNDWSRSFRNAIKPSPFKRNTPQHGYIYEKPAVPLPIRPGEPFDFPVNPDANLIKPVSTQAPEYLPPDEQVPVGSSSSPGDSSVVTSTQPSFSASVLPEAGATGSPGSTEVPGITLTTTSTAATSTTVEDIYKPRETTSSPTTQNPVENFDIRNNENENDYKPSENPINEPSESTNNNGFTGYLPESSSTEATQKETEAPSTLGPFTGYPRETPNPSSPTPESTTSASITGVGSTLTTQQSFDEDNGYNYDKPVLPPNLNEVVGEPGDINELATTTSRTTTTHKYIDFNIPPKPLPDLVVPAKPISEQPVEDITASEVSSVETTSVSLLDGTSSTSAPEYLPPNDANGTKQPDEITQKPESTNYPSSSSTYVSETTTSSGYKPESTTFGGYPEKDTTLSSGYPSQETTASEVFTRPSQETTSFGGYPSAESTSTFAPISETTSVYPNNGPQNVTISGVEGQPGSTSAPEYLPPDTNIRIGNDYPSEINSVASTDPQTEISSDSSPKFDNGPGPSQAPIEEMTIIAEINSLVPDADLPNSYFPPGSGEDLSGIRIVVEDTESLGQRHSVPSSTVPPLLQSSSTASDMITTYHPKSPQRTTPAESDAEGSELQPLVAAAEAPSETGYDYQIPSHTLDDQGYHYKIPSIPFP